LGEYTVGLYSGVVGLYTWELALYMGDTGA
jgi:hypothetical protein